MRVLKPAPSYDLLGREIHAADFVVFHNLVYRVVLPAGQFVRMELLDKSPTTKPVNKISSEVCLISTADITMWLLKRKKE